MLAGSKVSLHRESGRGGRNSGGVSRKAALRELERIFFSTSALIFGPWSRISFLTPDHMANETIGLV
jgi:hypothetical protein